ncbi:MAG: HAMP domain-containing sensor histidine kinase [Cyanobacteria bacterium P01_G01_bin.67]
MFQKTRLQLTLAYLGVSSLILTLFVVAVRWNYTRSLNQQFNVKLSNLTQAAAFNMDEEDGKLEADEDEILVNELQTIEWFDLEEQIVGKQGELELDIALDLKQLEKIQEYPDSIRSLIEPVYSQETEELIGYVRVSESLVELNNTLQRLDYGLGSGIAIALIASGLSSIWLTRQAMQPIEASFARLKQFTADASHELRSPLMAIKTNADVALKYPEGIRELDAEKFQAISSASNQMTKLTENLLLLARADKGIEFQLEPVHLNALLTDLMQLYKPQAEVKQLTWQLELEPELSLLGDRLLLTQLFANLIQNSLQYTSNGDSITVKGQKINSQIQIEITDTGIGIAPEHLNKIFERFWRADKSRSYQSRRSGLGLAIVKEILQLHHGKISVDSQLGKGSNFILIFHR